MATGVATPIRIRPNKAPFHAIVHTKARITTVPLTLTSVHSQRGVRRSLQFRKQLECSSAAATDWSANGTRPFTPPIVTRVQAGHGTSPIVILPGFGNCTDDYLNPFGDAASELSMHHSLTSRGFSVYIVPVERKDWFKIAQALLTPAFWTSKCTTNPAYTWYIGRIEETVKRAKMESQCEKVHLVGHSAGGWLARAYLGGVACPTTQADRGAAKLVGPRHCDVRSLVSLGSPHLSPPASAPDMTRGTLRWVNEQWPGAYFVEEGVKYVCVTGRTVKGDANAEKGTLSRYASVSYSQVCGNGDTVEGDAVVPNSSALLQDAKHLYLDGVYHSMSQVGTYDTPATGVWYGSDTVVDLWLSELQ